MPLNHIKALYYFRVNTNITQLKLQKCVKISSVRKIKNCHKTQNPSTFVSFYTNRFVPKRGKNNLSSKLYDNTTVNKIYNAKNTTRYIPMPTKNKSHYYIMFTSNRPQINQQNKLLATYTLPEMAITCRTNHLFTPLSPLHCNIDCNHALLCRLSAIECLRWSIFKQYIGLAYSH